MKLQVLVTTMYQTDLSKATQMNITGHVLLANQADRYDYDRQEHNGRVVEMITTPGRGLSKNRNTAIECSAEDTVYILFADDDLIFQDGYEKLVLDEFARHPEAEAIKFNLYDLSSVRTISMKPIDRFRKATRRSVTSSGVCGLVIRRDVLIKQNIRFNEYFGTGTEHYCGEDTIFLQEILNKKVRFYLSPVEIAGIDQTNSSWFQGYDEKYFKTTGMVFAAIHPRVAKLLAVRSAYRFSRRKNCDMIFSKILSYYWQGIRDYLK